MKGYESSMYNKKSYFLNEMESHHSLDLGIVFFTTEGIQHQVGGVAKYIRNFIIYLNDLRTFFSMKGISITLYAGEPALRNTIPSYSLHEFKTIKYILEESGGQFYKLINNTNGTAWVNQLDSWKIMSASAAAIALNVAEKHEAVLVLFGSTCLAMTQVYIHKQLKAFDADIRTIYLTHDSAFSQFYQEKNEDILSMDYLCSQWTKFTPNAKVGFVSNYMKQLFGEKYMVEAEAFIPTRSGIIPNEKRYEPLEEKQVIELLTKYKIPLDKKIIFSWGRADGYKRLDLIFAATEFLEDSYFAVAVTNSTFRELHNYVNNISFHGMLIENYKKFELINALLSWKNTVAICLLSENEPGAMAPMEAMLLCKRGGGFVITNDGGIYQELIIDEFNGFTVRNKPKELADKIIYLQEITSCKRKEIQENAYQTIIRNYDQRISYLETITEAIPRLKSYKADIINKM